MKAHNIDKNPKQQKVQKTLKKQSGSNDQRFDLSGIPQHYHAEVIKWRSFERQRPTNIPQPQDGQESVWDYPRPPHVEPVDAHIRVEFNAEEIANTHRAWRVIETAGAPVYYIPTEDIKQQFIAQIDKTTLCEWKGESDYFNVVVGKEIASEAAWRYPKPWGKFSVIAGYLAFNASKMNACWIDKEQVKPQPGGYYGGWISVNIIGPFKGDPGSEAW